MPQEVLSEFRDGVAKIVLNRPDMGNAIDAALAAALIAAIDRVAADERVRAVLLTGAGRMFCAGGDIAGMKASGADLGEHMARGVQPLHEAVLKLARLPVPVLSAVNGPVGGGGISLALCADLVLAGESMKLRGGYSAIGLTPDLGASWFLARRVGPARAKEILFLNRPLSAAECLAWGIVNEVHPDERLAHEAQALAARLATGATLALGRIKQLVDGAGERALASQLDRERDCMIASGRSDDGLEGVAAFVEKRPPRFRGR